MLSTEYAQALASPAPLNVTLLSTGGKGGFDVSCADKNDGTIIPDISGGVKDYVFLWSQGSSENILSGVGIGTFTLTVTDANRCSGTESITLNAPPVIDFTIAEMSSIKCYGDYSGSLEVQRLSNTIGNTSYQWSSGETSTSISNKAADDYSVTVKDSQGCTATRSIILDQPARYSVDIIATSDFNGAAIRCNGESNGSLTTIVSGPDMKPATAEFYTWSYNGNRLVEGITENTLEGVTAGIYNVEIQYNTFCKAEGTYALVQPEPIRTQIINVSNYNGSPISCHGSKDGVLKATALGGTGMEYVFAWNTGTKGPDIINAMTVYSPALTSSKSGPLEPLAHE